MKSEEPLTCYRISKRYNMNVAKVYITMKKLVALGLVIPKKGRGGVEYRIVDEDLRRLALKLSTRVVTYEAWRSRAARRTRFRSGLSRVSIPPLGVPSRQMLIKPTRMPGELDSLARLARMRFDGKYRMSSNGTYDSV